MDGVSVNYDGVRGLIVVVGVHVCSAITPEGVLGRTEVWHRKFRCGLHIPLPEHTSRSLLRHPKNRSRTINGGSVVKVVH
jgi:hypothetical protein